MLLVIGAVVGVIGVLTLPGQLSGWLGFGVWMLAWSFFVVRREWLAQRWAAQDAAEAAAEAAAAGD